MVQFYRGIILYIKDFVMTPILKEEHKNIQREAFQALREEYKYSVLDYIDLLSFLRQLGLFIEFVRPFGLQEDFSRASLFENNNNSHSIYSKVINNDFQLFESIEVRCRKVYSTYLM